MSGSHRLQSLTRAQRAAVMEKAIELAERPSAADTEAWVAAAAELGIEREVLLEAQAALERENARKEGPQSRQAILDAAAAKQRKRTLAMVGVVAAGVAVLGLQLAVDSLYDTESATSAVSSTPLEPFSTTVHAESGRWSTWTDSATLTVGTATVEGATAVQLSLAPLSAGGVANYRTTRIHGDLSALDTLELQVWSDGLEKVQPSFRRSKHAQWSLPPIQLQPGKNDLVIQLDDLRYQERAGKGKPWKATGTRALRDVELFQLKLGKNINPPGTSGTLKLGRVAVQ